MQPYPNSPPFGFPGPGQQGNARSNGSVPSYGWPQQQFVPPQFSQGQLPQGQFPQGQGGYNPYQQGQFMPQFMPYGGNSMPNLSGYNSPIGFSPANGQPFQLPGNAGFQMPNSGFDPARKRQTTRKAVFNFDNSSQPNSFTDSRGNSLPDRAFQGAQRDDVLNVKARIADAGLAFDLKGRYREIRCSFSFTHNSNYRAVITVDPAEVQLPFSVNTSPNHYSGTKVDITDLLNNGENCFVFNTLSIPSNLTVFLCWEAPNDIDQVVESIVKEREPYIIPTFNQPCSELCPITRKPIVCPGRGANCEHCQCFDLHGFLQNASETGSWSCPICHKQISFADLRHDPTFNPHTAPNDDDDFSGFLMEDYDNMPFEGFT